MSEYKYDKSTLLEQTNYGLDVIRRLFPECEKSGRFVHFKLRDEERTPSANVFKTKAGHYNVRDHGSGDSYNAIDLVMESEGLSFPDAYKWVAQTFGLNGSKTVAFHRAKMEIVPAEKDQKHGEYIFDYHDEIPAEHLAVLGPMVTDEICKRYNLYSAKSFVQIKKYPSDKKKHKSEKTHQYAGKTMQVVTHSTEQYPVFVFDFGTWQKIYQPLAKDFRFRYAGEKPRDFIFGMEDVAERYEESIDNDEEDPKLDKVIIATGGRDALNMAALNCPVVWMNSETATLDPDDFNTLREYAKNVYYLGDIDTTGVRQSVEFALQYIHLKIVWLPEGLKKYSYKGKPCKDFKDFVDHTNDPKRPDKLKDAFNGLLYDALPARFWDVLPKTKKEDPNKYYLNNEALYRFLNYKGFFRFEEDEAKDDFSFIRIQKNVVKRVKPHHISNFPTDYVRYKRSNIKLLNFIHRTGQLSEKSLSRLQKKELDFKDCSYNHQLFFFENQIWKITKNEITKHSYGKIDTPVWEDKIIPHQVHLQKEKSFEITKNEDGYDIEILTENNHFLNYLINTSRVHWRKCGDAPFKRKIKELDKDAADYEEQLQKVKEEKEQYRKENRFEIAEKGLTPEEIKEQKDHLINKIFAFGYLLHKQKVSDKAWCVFAMDHRISDIADSNGGSGKSLMLNMAIRNILRSNAYKPGRDKELFKNKHIYEGVSKHTDYVVFDDLDSHFPFDRVFSEITGDLPVNPKHGKGYVVPFLESGKYAMTSNFGIYKADSSTNRRILYTVFSDYYHDESDDDNEAYKPAMDFDGKQLFDQFTPEEWSGFFNFSASATQFFMSTNDKINPPLGNVSKRNVLQNMGDGFKEWADGYFTEENDKLDILAEKEIAFRNFEEKSKLKGWTSQRFKKSVTNWCKFYGYEMNPDEFVNKQGHCKHHSAELGKTAEMFFIRTPNPTNPTKPRTTQEDVTDDLDF